jgi:hypothetical protein
MKKINFLIACYAIIIILSNSAIAARQSMVSSPSASGQGENENHQLKFSPSAQEVAELLGIKTKLERLYALSDKDRGLTDSPMSAEALALRQEILESVISTSLSVDGVIAEIDDEISKSNETRAVLEARRDHALAVNNVINFVSGGGLGIVSSALQINDSTAVWGNIAGIVGGGVSIALSLVGLRQQKGAQTPLEESPNMLAKIFDRKTEFHSDYPEEIWRYLNSSPPSVSGQATRREQLIDRWVKEGRIDDINSQKGQHKIDLLTSGVSQKKRLSIDTLMDRAAMLADLRARISLMKRDLSKLTLELKSH